MFNRLRDQRRSQEKSHQNDDYLKQAMQKSCLPAVRYNSALLAFRPDAT